MKHSSRTFDLKIMLNTFASICVEDETWFFIPVSRPYNNHYTKKRILSHEKHLNTLSKSSNN